MYELMYVFNTTALFFMVCNYSTVNLGTSFLKIFNGIRLSLAPMSTVYTMQVCLWLVQDSSLVNITDLHGFKINIS